MCVCVCVCVSCKDGDIQKQREAYEGMKRDLQHRLQEVEGELALQKQVNTHTHTLTPIHTD